MGSLIAEKSLTENNQVEISNLKAGTYIIRVISDEIEYLPRKIVITY
jgi:hypothetical protein